jgi:hypothetical protein
MFHTIFIGFRYNICVENHLRFASLLANALDNSIGIWKLRFGLSAVFDLVPGLGDFVDVFLSLYLVWIALRLNVPKNRIAEMVWNIGLNFVVGMIPVFGDAIYFFRKTNLKNLKIIQEFVKTYPLQGNIMN